MKLGARIEQLNTHNKTVETTKGEILNYDKLILTTGARVRRLSVPGANLPGVFYLRDTSDVLSIKSETARGKHAVIIGGGYIGLETAASLRKLGVEVTVLEANQATDRGRSGGGTGSPY